MKDIEKVEPFYAGAMVDLCWFCRHRDQEANGYAAYPEGIPQEILRVNVDHRLPYLGDHGIQFALREDLDENAYQWLLQDLFADTWGRDEAAMRQEKERYAAAIRDILERRKHPLSMAR
jgi:hypothetical protein